RFDGAGAVDRRGERNARPPTGAAGAERARRAVSSAVVAEVELAGGATLLREPGLAQLAAFLFGRAAPDARLLVGGERELETLVVHVAGGADSPGRLDLLEGGPGAADREEDVGVGIAARGATAPRVHVPVVGPDPSERHEASGTRGRHASSCESGTTCARAHVHKHPRAAHLEVVPQGIDRCTNAQ